MYKNLKRLAAFSALIICVSCKIGNTNESEVARAETNLSNSQNVPLNNSANEQSSNISNQAKEDSENKRKQGEREKDLWENINGRWYATANTGENASAYEKAYMIYYEFSIENHHVIVRSSEASYTVGYEPHMPPLSVEADCQLKIEDFDEKTPGDFDDYKLKNYNCKTDSDLDFTVSYENGKFKSISYFDFRGNHELSRKKTF